MSCAWIHCAVADGERTESEKEIELNGAKSGVGHTSGLCELVCLSRSRAARKGMLKPFTKSCSIISNL